MRVMIRLLGIAGIFLASAAYGQTPPPVLGDSAKAAVGTWEFSNADRDKTCTLILKSDPAPNGFKLEFDKSCVNRFAIVGTVTAWSFPDNDLLRLLDAQGRAVVEFSEVEAVMYEAPTPGVGVLFLQNPAAAATAPMQPDKVAGDWSIVRGKAPVCAITLSTTVLRDGFALTVKPGCDAAIARLNFAEWKLDGDELMLVPARGAPWRFEEDDDNIWLRVPEGSEAIRLVRP